MQTLANLLGTTILAVQLACAGSGGATPPAAPAATPRPPLDPNTPTDAEGYVYKTVRIGQQTWMAENLRAARDVDGRPINGAYAYNNQESNVAIHGRLYTMEAARKTVIAGWHLPTYEDWSRLVDAVGPDQSAQRLLQGGNSGFNATFSGYRDYWGGYRELGTWCAYWTSSLMTEAPDHAHTVHLYGDKPAVEREGAGVIGGHSVRLVRD